MSNRETINVSDLDSLDDDDDTVESSSSIQVVDSSSPVKFGNRVEVESSSPIKRVKRLHGLADRFGYQAPKKQHRLPGMTIEQSSMVESLIKEFPMVPQSQIAKVVKRNNNLIDARKFIKSIHKTIKPIRRMKIHKKTPRSLLRNDIASSKVTFGTKATIAQRYKKGKNDLFIDIDGDEYGKSNNGSKKRRLVRWVKSDKEDYSIASRARRLKRRHVIEIDSDDELDEEAEQLEKIKERRRKKREEREKQEDQYAEDNFDESDEDVTEESSGENQLDFEQRVLKFLNEADARDLVDITGIQPTIARLFINGRPYYSLEEIGVKQLDPEAEKKTKKNYRSRRKPAGEKILETTMRKLKGYETVESLVTKCKGLGMVIEKEIKKWGVKVDGDAGELQIIDVNSNKKEDDTNDDQNNDEDIESVENKKEANNNNSDDDDIMVMAANKYSSDYDDYTSDSSDDEDYGNASKKKDKLLKMKDRSLTPSNVNRSIKFFRKKPTLMADSCQLKGYQQVGINWLTLLYKKHFSCILADEMGLGKTIEVIAFLAHLKEIGSEGPHLIVVPASTLENWLREFQKFAPSLDVRPYYGTQVERVELREELSEDPDYDVLVTTYSMATGNKYDQGFLRARSFNVIVYDEGHMLKNSTSTRYKKLMRLRAQFRLLLTGTPLQNNLKELISLLSFILPQVFNEKKSELEELFDQRTSTNASNDKMSEEDKKLNPLLSQQAITRARTMMTPFVLRRTKDQVMKYLPAKHSHIVYCDFTPAQKWLYDDAVTLARYRIKEGRRRRNLSADVVHKLPKLEPAGNYIMSLRKACLHPMLFRYLYTDDVLRVMARKIMRNPEYYDANEQYIYEDMTVMTDFELNQLTHNYPKQLGDYSLPTGFYLHSGKITKLVELVTQMMQRKEKVLVFSLFTQLLDILEKVLSFKKIKFVRLDGATSVNERQNIIDTFTDDKTIPVFLLSTKAGGFGINLIAATNVIIYDLSFNPHDDKQAEDRAHRVGQTKEVNVYRLICKNTIEENILKVAYNKLELDNTMMNKGQNIEDALIKDIGGDDGIDDDKSNAANKDEKETGNNNNGDTKDDNKKNNSADNCDNKIKDEKNEETVTVIPDTPKKAERKGLLGQAVENSGPVQTGIQKPIVKRIDDPGYTMKFPMDMPPPIVVKKPKPEPKSPEPANQRVNLDELGFSDIEEQDDPEDADYGGSSNKSRKKSKSPKREETPKKEEDSKNPEQTKDKAKSSDAVKAVSDKPIKTKPASVKHSGLDLIISSVRKVHSTKADKTVNIV